MKGVPERLAPVLAALLESGRASGTVSLDAVGEAIGVRAASTADIEALVDALEEGGVRVSAPEGASGEASLARVLTAARALRKELGRPPNVRELALATGLDEVAVRHALGLAKVMQR